jgi:RNA:NAD 2'-phosphotransferase (TPT1/KptA family)
MITRDELARIVATSDKQRFALSPDGECIRANQGRVFGNDPAMVADAFA